MNPSAFLLKKLREHTAAETERRVIGIDLGTTNSTVAQIRIPVEVDSPAIDICDCIPVAQMTTVGPVTSPIVPSIVAQTKDGQLWIGEGAKRLRINARDHGLLFEKNLFYETKNVMGLRKTYYRADEKFDHARKIGGCVLEFLNDAARVDSGTPVTRTVVTVPASFQINQRADTLEAARLAGLQLTQFDLLDEPIAAFLDYLFSYGSEFELDRPVNLLVFDFGGGTCDVYVARLSPDDGGSTLKIETLSVSRYHKLGGGDLDAAIVHEVLLPQLMKENNLEERHYGWDEKKKVLEPQLLGTAEALKQGICREIERMEKFGRYTEDAKPGIVATQPPVSCKVGKDQLFLKNPSLSATQWEEILSPFLDEDASGLFVRETEYRTPLSIFAPVLDAVSRSGLETSEIDCVLEAGGSSMIPQVRHAICKHFPEAKILAFPDSMAAHTAIARGATWHALWLEVTGRPLIQPVVSEAIAIMTAKDKPLILIQAGSAIPYPLSGGWDRVEGLSIPRNIGDGLKIEVVTWPGKQVILEMFPEFDDDHAGEPIVIDYRFSAAREFSCRVCLKHDPEVRFESTVENPLTNMVSPSAKRMEIEEIEEYLRKNNGGSVNDRDRFIRLAELYADIKFLEKAVVILRSLQAKLVAPDPWVLNRIAMYYDEMGDYNRMEKHYRQAALVSRGWAGPLFNLALHFRRKKRMEAALDTIDEAIAKQYEVAPHHVLRGRCLADLSRKEDAADAMANAESLFGDLEDMSDWELSWYQEWAGFTGKRDDAERAKAEVTRRSAGRGVARDNYQLPVQGDGNEPF